jgi:hypothetical protein
MQAKSPQNEDFAYLSRRNKGNKRNFPITNYYNDHELNELYSPPDFCPAEIKEIKESAYGTAAHRSEATIISIILASLR